MTDIQDLSALRRTAILGCGALRSRQASVTLSAVLALSPVANIPVRASFDEVAILWDRSQPSSVVVRIPLATGWTMDGVFQVDPMPFASQVLRGALDLTADRDLAGEIAARRPAHALDWHFGVQTHVRLSKSWDLSLGSGWSVGDPIRVLGDFSQDVGRDVDFEWSDTTGSRTNDADLGSTGEAVVWLRIGASF